MRGEIEQRDLAVAARPMLDARVRNQLAHRLVEPRQSIADHVREQRAGERLRHRSRLEQRLRRRRAIREDAPLAARVHANRDAAARARRQHAILQRIREIAIHHRLQARRVDRRQRPIGCQRRNRLHRRREDSTRTARRCPPRGAARAPSTSSAVINAATFANSSVRGRTGSGPSTWTSCRSGNIDCQLKIANNPTTSIVAAIRRWTFSQPSRIRTCGAGACSSAASSRRISG